jgi:hypothetical protein
MVFQSNRARTPNFSFFQRFGSPRSSENEWVRVEFAGLVLPVMSTCRTRKSLRSILLCTCILALYSPMSHAESVVNLPYPTPDAFGVTPASTFDETGKRVGDASIEISLREDGHVMLKMLSGYDDGARIVLDAELAPVTVAETRMLRVLHESSHSFDPDGKPLVRLDIDHVEEEASCTDPEDKANRSTMPLPSPDRVVNVPLNLLLRPLGQNGLSTINTQTFFCLGGARVMGFNAVLQDKAEPNGAPDDHIREIRYEPDGKSFISWAAKAVAPKISFWMNTQDRGAYVGHRMPLYSKGPIVYVIADGVDPKRLIAR